MELYRVEQKVAHFCDANLVGLVILGGFMDIGTIGLGLVMIGLGIMTIALGAVLGGFAILCLKDMFS